MPKIALNNVNMVENMAKIFGQYGHFGQNQPFLAVIGRVISVVIISNVFMNPRFQYLLITCISMSN